MIRIYNINGLGYTTILKGQQLQIIILKDIMKAKKTPNSGSKLKTDKILRTSLIQMGTTSSD